VREKETENRKQKHKQEQKKGKGWNFNLTFMDSLFYAKNFFFLKIKKMLATMGIHKKILNIIILFYNNLHFVNLMIVSTNDLQM
jgi:hypothetical protein